MMSSANIMLRLPWGLFSLEATEYMEITNISWNWKGIDSMLEDSIEVDRLR